MATAYQFNAHLISIGAAAADSLADGMMILFNNRAPCDIAEYCYIHDQGRDQGVISLESTLLLDDIAYIVTAVGAVANQNLQQLGHITIWFDGASIPELPGCIHVLGPMLPNLQVGSHIIFG